MIDLRPIRGDEGAAALAVLDAGSRELWGLDVQELRTRCDPLDDLVDPAAHYAERRGAFLVLADEGRVIGSGGIAALGSKTAELKRRGLSRRTREGARQADGRGSSRVRATERLSLRAVEGSDARGSRAGGPALRASRIPYDRPLSRGAVRAVDGTGPLACPVSEGC